MPQRVHWCGLVRSLSHCVGTYAHTFVYSVHTHTLRTLRLLRPCTYCDANRFKLCYSEYRTFLPGANTNSVCVCVSVCPECSSKLRLVQFALN